MRLFELGLRNLMDMAIMIHIGRCGIIGAKRTTIAAALRVSYDTARSGVDRLCELGLVTSISKDHTQGTPMNFVCTLKGWKLLTTPADFTLFPYAQMELGKRQSAKTEGPAGSSTLNPPEPI